MKSVALAFSVVLLFGCAKSDSQLVSKPEIEAMKVQIEELNKRVTDLNQKISLLAEGQTAIKSYILKDGTKATDDVNSGAPQVVPRPGF